VGVLILPSAPPPEEEAYHVPSPLGRAREGVLTPPNLTCKGRPIFTFPPLRGGPGWGFQTMIPLQTSPKGEAYLVPSPPGRANEGFRKLNYPPSTPPPQGEANTAVPSPLGRVREGVSLPNPHPITHQPTLTRLQGRLGPDVDHPSFRA